MDTTNSSRELHLTVANEDYLECMVRIESEEGETNGVRSVDIAQRLGVSKASVNKAVSALKASELVEQSHYGKVVLTGSAAARLVRLSGTVIASSARFWFRSSVSNLSEPIPRPA